MRILFSLIIFISFTCHLQAQAILTLDNGGIMNIVGNAYLVIDNPNTNAITRNTSGHIVSEGQNNRIVWYTKTNTGTYVVPFGRATSYIPLTFTISVAGTETSANSGRFTLSTYRTTTFENSLNLPTGVANFLSAGANADAKAADRFWRIDASTGYILAPSLTNITFTYFTAEITGSNTITEANLGAQRWNSIISDWGDFMPSGTVNAAANTVTVNAITPANLFTWWTLVDNTMPLPVSLQEATSRCENNEIVINWKTITETNNSHFEIERSFDGNDFFPVAIIAGSGNSSTLINYSWIDNQFSNKTTYYKLFQTDLDGTRTLLSTLTAEPCANSSSIKDLDINAQITNQGIDIRINSPEDLNTSELYLFDSSGKLIFSSNLNLLKGDNRINYLRELAEGVYLVRVSGKYNKSVKLINKGQ